MNPIDTFIAGCQADGIWSSMQACCVLGWYPTLAQALANPLVGPAPTNN